MIIQTASNVVTLLESDGMRFVHSYGTLVGIITPEGTAFKSSTKYSQTTSKHCNKHLPSHADLVTSDELHEMKENHAKYGKLTRV